MAPKSTAASIKRVSESAIEELAQLGARTFLEAYSGLAPMAALQAHVDTAFSLQAIRSEFANPDVVYFVARCAHQSIGYAKLVTGFWIDQQHDAESAYFERNYVLREFQNQGIGLGLYQARIDEALRRGCRRAWLRVWDQNARAIKFHERNGFCKVGERSFRVNLPDGSTYTDTDWVMTRFF